MVEKLAQWEFVNKQPHNNITSQIVLVKSGTVWFNVCARVYCTCVLIGNESQRLNFHSIHSLFPAQVVAKSGKPVPRVFCLVLSNMDWREIWTKDTPVFIIVSGILVFMYRNGKSTTKAHIFFFRWRRRDSSLISPFVWTDRGKLVWYLQVFILCICSLFYSFLSQ